MRIVLYIILTLTVLCFAQCKDELFNGGDTVTKEFRIEEPFNNIEITADFDIELVQDTVNKAIVTCGENLMNDVQVTSENNNLTLNHNVKYSWSRDYSKIQVKLHLKSISYINVRKPCHIFTTDTFKTDNFYFVDWNKFTEMDVCLDVYNLYVVMSSDNFGRFTLRGKAVNANLIQWGSAFILADSMRIENCNVEHRSAGDVHVNVAKELKVSLKSIGNVYCSSKPDTVIITEQLSSGKLIFEN
ncbi:MAG TPA: DUF2807 domain-containing protein [Bacteroidales bacterium]|nr:DUF2807 domain-containing protein [Bacteroidales bacterium]